MENNNYNKERYYQLSAYLDWQGREGYLKLLEDFHKKKCKNFEFCFAFDERGLLIEDIADILKSNLILLSFSTDEKYNSFSEFITYIVEICKAYIENAENNDTMAQIEFEIEMKEFYFQILDILKTNPTLMKESTDFSELIDQLNWEVKDQYFELIEEFLDEDELSNFLNFKKKSESIMEVAKKLESNSIPLEIKYQALGFSNFIYILIQLFDRWKIKSEISPKILKSWVRKILAEMKSHYS